MKNERLIETIKPYLTEHYEKCGAEWNTFTPGEDPIPIGWPIYNQEEVTGVLTALLDFRLSSGPFVKQFEKKFSSYQGSANATAVNSGTSANILALNTLREMKLLKPGQEVIIPAATFSAVASPILQNRCIPVYVDVEQDSYNIDPTQMENAISDKTGALMPVHSLGNPADMKRISEIGEQHNLPVIEDFCESHGAAIGNKKVGTFGTLSTLSFFVAHNMTTGEGGMVFSDNEEVDDIMKSLREFGRIKTDERYPYINDELKEYDKQYVFERVGYNMRMSDPTAAFGMAQLEKLDGFNQKRRENARYYTTKLSKFNHLIQLPSEKPNTTHTYYGYVIGIKDQTITRQKFLDFLESRKIETRPFMAGSLPDQPGFKHEPHRVMGELQNTKWLRDNSFFIGCHPLLDKQRLEYVSEVIREFLEEQE